MSIFSKNAPRWNQHKYAEFIRTFFVNRGVKEDNIVQYLTHQEVFYDPFLLQDMAIAVDVIKYHIASNSNILIFGDYDVDGITSSAILKRAIEAYSNGANVHITIPSRTDGYGLLISSTDKIIDAGVNLVICIDNGTKSVEAVKRLIEFSIDVVVLDHHAIAHTDETVIGLAKAVVNPQRHDCAYPNKSMCAATVALKFVYALFNQGGTHKNIPRNLYDFAWQSATVATVADVMDMRDLENRHIVRTGLRSMNSTPVPFLQAIAKVKNVKSFNMECIAFVVSPLINAAGRMNDVQASVYLVNETTLRNAVGYAERANELNNKRKKYQDIHFNVAKSHIGDMSDDSRVIGVVLECGHGLAGTIAAQISREYGRPAFIFTEHNSILSGSGRYSGKAINLHELVQSEHSYLIKSGGHSGAVGLSLNAENLSPFIEKLNSNLGDRAYVIEEYNDTPIPEFELPLYGCDEEFIDVLDAISPFGVESFSAPVFCVKHVWVEGCYVFAQKHLSVKISDEYGNTRECLAWNYADEYENIVQKQGKMVGIVYRLNMETVNLQPHEQKLIFEGILT